MFDLIVVPCGGKKLDHPAPAGDLYIGSYHRACRRAAEALHPARILILSALHGLVELDQMLAPYDLRMGQPGSVTTSTLREQARRLGVDSAEQVAVLAGSRYAEAARAVWPNAELPLRGTRGMGEQLAVLNQIAARGQLR